MKIVINKRYGGFGLSDEAKALFKERFPELKTWDRNSPELIEIVEALGERADGKYAKLVIVEIPDDVKWIIEDYDGVEWIAEEHRTWHD